MPDSRRSRSLSIAAGSALLALMAAVPGLSAAEGEDFATADAAAQTDMGTPDGLRFAEALGQAFGREHGQTIGKCAKDAKRSEFADFDLLLQVDGSGVVDRAMVKPANSFSLCVAGKMPGWRTSAPPHPGFWAKVSVNLGRK